MYSVIHEEIKGELKQWQDYHSQLLIFAKKKKKEKRKKQPQLPETD